MKQVIRAGPPTSERRALRKPVHNRTENRATKPCSPQRVAKGGMLSLTIMVRIKIIVHSLHLLSEYNLKSIHKLSTATSVIE
jgi:hypothetical protein